MQQKPLHISGKSSIGTIGGYGDSAKLGYSQMKQLWKRDFLEYGTFARLVGRVENMEYMERGDICFMEISKYIH